MNAFIVIGSDGLWDFISNEKMLEVISEKFDQYYQAPQDMKDLLDPEIAVDSLVNLAS